MKILWNAGIVNIVWMLWGTRNRKNFDNVRPNINVVLQALQNVLRKIDNRRFGITWNSTIEINLLQNLSLALTVCRAPKTISVCWNPPPAG